MFKAASSVLELQAQCLMIKQESGLWCPCFLMNYFTKQTKNVQNTTHKLLFKMLHLLFIH